MCSVKKNVSSEDNAVASRSGKYGHDRIVVSTSRCGRDNPGSNPGHGMPALLPS